MKFGLFIFFAFLGSNLVAQDSGIRNEELTFSIGVAELDVQKLSQSDNLDFLNYVDSYPDYIDFITVKLGYQFDFLAKMSADMQLILMDDIIPDNFDLSAYYNFNRKVGLGVGSVLTKAFISSFDADHSKQLPGYLLVYENYRTVTAYDLGFYVSPKLEIIHSNGINIASTLDMGLSSFLTYSISYSYKKDRSNERLNYHYKTTPVFQPFINPGLQIGTRSFKFNSLSVGCWLNSGFFYAQKSIDYTQTTHSWTAENSARTEIRSPKHTFYRFELDFGLSIKWK